MDDRTAAISSIAGTLLPAGPREGDQIDLTALPLIYRIALGATQPLGHTYDMTIRRDGALITVPVTSVEFDSAANPGLLEYLLDRQSASTALLG